MTDDATAPEGIDARVPNVARMYDYFLGGKDNYAADREAAERLLAVAPETRFSVWDNRAFLRRAVRHLAAQGYRQFLDIGAGLPTNANVHEVAREITPDARVVYVDYDPVVVTHGRALLAGASGVTVIQGDARELEALLADEDLRELIDLSEPVAVLLVAVLHFIPDDQNPRGIIARLRESMAPGSALVLSHVTGEASREEAASTAKSVYDSSSASLALRTKAEIATFFEGFELIEPGLVYAPEWRPGITDRAAHPETSFIFAGVAHR